MNNHEIEVFATMQDALVAVDEYVANGYYATAHKAVDGSFVVESWED